jgi:predicted AlkP superfamily pyrophosphatase or phosphodiesterase
VDEVPFLQRAMRDGVVSQITSQFPSTTAAHVTTIHTGLPVGASGVFEWHYYEPVVDDVISPLLYSLATDVQRESLGLDDRALPERLFPTRDWYGRPLFYERLTSAGVACHVHQFQDYARSTYSQAVCRGAKLMPFGSLRHGLANVAGSLKAGGGPAYHFGYIDSIDYALHKHGPGSPMVDSVVRDVFALIEEELVNEVAGHGGDTLLLMIADHGQVEVDPERAFYLNWRVKGIESKLRRNEAGELLRFGGSARDLFLYVRPEHVESLHAELREKLLGRAEVYRVDDLIRRGIFGEVPPNSPLPKRAGELVILPYRDQTVYWREEKFDMHFRGHHGGLTREEMEVPIIAMRL